MFVVSCCPCPGATSAEARMKFPAGLGLGFAFRVPPSHPLTRFHSTASFSPSYHIVTSGATQDSSGGLFRGFGRKIGETRASIAVCSKSIPPSRGTLPKVDKPELRAIRRFSFSVRPGVVSTGVFAAHSRALWILRQAIVHRTEPPGARVGQRVVVH